MQKRYHKRPQFKDLLKNGFFVWISCFLIAEGLIYRYQFGVKPFEQLLFYLRAPMKGVSLSPLIWHLGMSALLSIGLFYLSLVVKFLSGRGLRKKKYQQIMLLVSLYFFLFLMDIPQYLWYQLHQDEGMEQYYHDPSTVNFEFPEKKRNLIYLFLESMETTYADKRWGGGVEGNLIPYLSQRALDPANLHFSDTENLGGDHGIASIGFTTAGMVAQTSGLPLKVSLIEKAENEENLLLPGAIALGDLLKKQGYHLELLLGSDASFGGRRDYFLRHGPYEIDDLLKARADGRLPEDYYVYWGYEDDKLYEFARNRLTELAKEGEPFCYTMLTMDSHFPDGNPDPEFPMPYEDSYPNAIYQSDLRLELFLRWLEGQDFYENTTVILAGDHLSMAESFFRTLEDPRRRIYTLIMNPAQRPPEHRIKRRNFTVLDLFPTTLRAMGVQMDHEHLGYGVSLYSEESTLIERMGAEKLEDMLRSRSEFYDEMLKLTKPSDE